MYKSIKKHHVPPPDTDVLKKQHPKGRAESVLRWALRGLSAGSDALGKHHRSSGLPGTGLRQRKSMARWDRQGVSCRGSVPASRDKTTPGIQRLSQQPGAQDNEQTCQRSSPAVQGTHVRALVPTAAPRRRNFKRWPLSPGKSGAELQLTLERNAAKAKRTTTSGWCSAQLLSSTAIKFSLTVSATETQTVT